MRYSATFRRTFALIVRNSTVYIRDTEIAYNASVLINSDVMHTPRKPFATPGTLLASNEVGRSRMAQSTATVIVQTVTIKPATTSQPGASPGTIVVTRPSESSVAPFVSRQTGVNSTSIKRA
jgi:hypothetical protein